MRRSVILRSVFSWTCRFVNLTDVLSRERANSPTRGSGVKSDALSLRPRGRRSLIGVCDAMALKSGITRGNGKRCYPLIHKAG